MLGRRYNVPDINVPEENSSNHYCKFLPKFHPELNPIERVWSRMKWYIRQMVDGNMSTLTLLMLQGLSYPDNNNLKNLTITTIRKYIRLTQAYLLAYDNVLDIVAAEEWLKQRRSHRGYRGKMDDVLEKLYFPNGRENKSSDEEVDNIEDYGTIAANISHEVAEAMSLLGHNQKEILPKGVAELYDDYVCGDEDRDINEYTVVYDDGVDVNSSVEI